jgi:hypothetical protein
MARRKKRKATSRRRSRRMGSTGKNQVMDIAGIAAGAAIATIVTGKLFPNMNEKIKNAAVIGIGAFLMPKLVKSSIGQNLGNGMIAAGSIGLLKNFNVIGAISDVMDVPVTFGAIDDNIALISGTDSVMAGDELAVMSGSEEDYDY